MRYFVTIPGLSDSIFTQRAEYERAKKYKT